MSAIPKHPSRQLRVDSLQTYRWGLLGNAVSVPVAQWIGKALAQPYNHKYVSGPSDGPMLSQDTGADTAHCLQLGCSHPYSRLVAMLSSHLSGCFTEPTL